MSEQFNAYTLNADGSVEPAMMAELTYPMGEQTINSAPDATKTPGTFAHVLHVAGPTVDWVRVALWSKAVSLDSVRAPRVLVVPFLPSARGDKNFPSPAAINAQMCAQADITHLVVADPHSPFWIDTMQRARAGNEVDVVELGALDFLKTAEMATIARSVDAVVAPDKGAAQRAGKVATWLDIPLYIAGKSRDQGTGRLLSYVLPGKAELVGKKVLVVDDICDGGGTFALLAEQLPGSDLNLWVTHGGFTKGLAPLKDYTVHTSNTLAGQMAPDVVAGLERLTRIEPLINDAVLTIIGKKA